MNPYLQDIRSLFETGLDLSTLNDSRILVTGATGLIGSCLVDVLLTNPHRNYQVYALGRNEERARQRFNNYWETADFHFIRHDISLPLDSDICFDYIIHAASNASPNFFKEKPVEVIKSNIIGVENHDFETAVKAIYYQSYGCGVHRHIGQIGRHQKPGTPSCVPKWNQSVPP